MSTAKRDGPTIGASSHEPLFIVDNEPGGRTGIQYLRDWTDVASALDVATGCFEIGSLLDLDGDWQKLDKIRILMGDEVGGRTRRVLLDGVRGRAEADLERSLEDDKRANPFLEGGPAIVDALTDGRIECRVYNRDKFHAKAYITHGRLDVVGSQALVGSSNFTRPGLTQNIELNIKLESGSEVAQLQDWYERHWDDAVDITEDVLKEISRHTRDFTPFEVYARSLQALVSRHNLGDSAWEASRSRMFDRLDRYQQEGYWALLDIARQHGGALLCDGVGLGKTYVGLMLIERLAVCENKRVVLFAPKSVTESVWTPEIKKLLPHIGGVGDTADYSSLSVFNHTDLSRTGDFPGRFERITEMADIVIIDEAHHFRNRGKQGDEENPEERSRYWRLRDLISGGDRPKTVFLLTATPINNSLNDFRHLVQLISGEDDSHFAPTLGVNSLTARLNAITAEITRSIGEDVPMSESLETAQDLLAGDELFRGLVVQRSRSYAQESQKLQGHGTTVFPKRDKPRVAKYSIRKSHGKLLGLIDDAFEKKEPLFSLAIYYPLAYSLSDDVDPFAENRQRQVVGLIRTNFLKRFESSVYAFERSCDRLLRKLLAFLEKNKETDAEAKNLERWLRRHEDLLGYTHDRQLELWGDDPSDTGEEDAEELIPADLVGKTEHLRRDEYDVPAIFDETYNDLDQLVLLLEECRRFSEDKDDKLGELKRLLKSKDLKQRKVLIFSEFADTARYLRRHLQKAGIDGVVQIDSGSSINRADAIRRFSPYYNNSSSLQLAESGQSEIRILIATDILSEGLNLQDATRLINYDIHWNPVRLMQRIGRVDRRLNPEVEKRLVSDHPTVAGDRGHIAFWNFLPPDELDDLLRLYQRVSHKTLLISKTLGIEGKQLLTPEDDYEALKEFNAAYEGTVSPAEKLHLEYQQLTDEDETLEPRLEALPAGIFSGRSTDVDGPRVFLCYELPALDAQLGQFTLEAGITRWHVFDPGSGEVTHTNDEAIAELIRSKPDTPRSCLQPKAALLAAKKATDTHIRNSHMKQLNVPLEAPKPKLVSWMEVNPA